MAGFRSGGPPTTWQRLVINYRSRFQHRPGRDGVLYGGLLVVLVCYSFIGSFGPFFVPLCEKVLPDLPFLNPDFNPDPCLTTRFVQLGGLTLRECQHIRGTIMSVLLGIVIGISRRAPDRPAGIRSSSITSLGACCFTICGNYACEAGPMSWDASRISAAIPSGVGFLAGALIWKGFVKLSDDGPDVHQVHGLSTAASAWISAAIGTACGGDMYSAAMVSVMVIVLLLRFGPKNSEMMVPGAEDKSGGADSAGTGAPLPTRCQPELMRSGGLTEPLLGADGARRRS